MVDLVLEAAGEGAGAVQSDLVAVDVEAADGGGGAAGQFGVLAGDREAALGVGHQVAVLG